tara:strand:+ start:296 stop:700 length:405 start_codon:yes stop_codon:yes gene_type:complete
MKESKTNSTSWWNNPALAKQAADILDNANPDDTVAVSYEDGKIVTETYSGEALEVAQPMLPAQPKKRGRPEKVSKNMFAKAWNNCNSLKELAELLGVPKLSASVKASNLRKTGRYLKKYKRGAKRKQPRLTSAT